MGSSFYTESEDSLFVFNHIRSCLPIATNTYVNLASSPLVKMVHSLIPTDPKLGTPGRWEDRL